MQILRRHNVFEHFRVFSGAAGEGARRARVIVLEETRFVEWLHRRVLAPEEAIPQRNAAIGSFIGVQNLKMLLRHIVFKHFRIFFRPGLWPLAATKKKDGDVSFGYLIAKCAQLIVEQIWIVVCVICFGLEFSSCCQWALLHHNARRATLIYLGSPGCSLGLLVLRFVVITFVNLLVLL